MIPFIYAPFAGMLPPVAFIFALFFARTNIVRLILVVSFWLVTLVIGGWNLMLAWVLRDGLGSDSVTSYGGVAIARFLSGAWPVMALCLLLGFGAWMANRVALCRIAKRS